jgi:hypothetical protein
MSLCAYLEQNPKLRVVAMAGWVATDGEEALIVVFEPKPEVAS